MKRVLVIGGFDPSGGAGLLMDVKMLTLSGLACASVPTALTFQSTKTFESWKPIESKDFERMLKLTLSDLPPVGVKIGMLATPEIVSLTAKYLNRYREKIKWIVCDPVLRATLGKNLFSGETFLEAFIRDLLPLIDYLTPNISEAKALTGLEMKDISDMKKAGHKLQAYGVKHVTITGFKRKGLILNYYSGEGERIFTIKELPYEFHGTGCALSSLILAFLLLGFCPKEALSKAMRRLSLYLKKALTLEPSGPLRLIH
ncbi:MAG: hydroxymethylpyrimidine/phosphomethylpyrimidine kinase [Caldimicrobium sp.]|nr:hydroxymethylpyrimidine/phosphomethylpyrimidine kinase [Caldimicrobium sp.]MCX7612724.1 hydroxymethylpyrimidine/phosphomethylpyrimidine kinase [Caldimicrobium sp.]MDW8183337.1 hydroxymethylpyrimidine/phosphomethylpyrimidine kinase [Caldimicrobium sp.]